MSSQSYSPVPRQPLERTFIVAISILGLVALLQAGALLIRFAPEIQRAGQAAEVKTEAAVEPVEVSVAEAESATMPLPPAEVRQMAQQLLDQAASRRRVGDWPRALAAVQEADRILPGEPGILFFLAETYEEAGQRPEALATLQRVVQTAPNHWHPKAAELRAEAASILQRLEPAPAEQAASAASGTDAGEETLGMRDEIGIPPGSVLGIVDCKLTDGSEGVKVLRVATKASPTEKIDPSAWHAVVYFYERNDLGEIVQTESETSSQWLTPDIDWADGGPELLEVRYPMPTAPEGGSANTFYGYMVGIYYKGELQDSRVEPGSLQEKSSTALPLYMAQPSE